MDADCRETLQNGSQPLQTHDSGIRTAGIFCRKDCRHLNGARYGGYQCEAFERHLTRGPAQSGPFRCSICIGLDSIVHDLDPIVRMLP